MKNLTFVVLILLLNSIFFKNHAFAKKMVLPRIINNNVLIGETVQKLLVSKVADFKLFETKNFSKEVLDLKLSHPMAIEGDFNNDDLRDIVLYGYSQKNKKIYVIAAVSIKKENSFKLFNLHEDEFSVLLLNKNHMYLNLGKKDLKLGLKRDVIQIETYMDGGGSVDPYYYSMSSKTMIPFLGTMD